MLERGESWTLGSRKTVFTAANLKEMKTVEEAILAAGNYTKFCLIEYDEDGNSLGCAERVSPVLHFFPSKQTLPNGTVVFVPDGKGELVDDIDAVVRRMSSDRLKYGYYLDSSFDKDTLVADMTRTKFPVGFPLPGFSSKVRTRGFRIMPFYLAWWFNLILNPLIS